MSSFTEIVNGKAHTVAPLGVFVVPRSAVHGDAYARVDEESTQFVESVPLLDAGFVRDGEVLVDRGTLEEMRVEHPEEMRAVAAQELVQVDGQWLLAETPWVTAPSSVEPALRLIFGDRLVSRPLSLDEYALYRCKGIDSGSELAERVREEGGPLSLEPQREMKCQLRNGTPDPKTPSQWHHEEIGRALGTQSADPVKIGLLDEGVASNTQELNLVDNFRLWLDKGAGIRSLVNSGSSGVHGTLSACLAAAQVNGTGGEGVSPNSPIVSGIPGADCRFTLVEVAESLALLSSKGARVIFSSLQLWSCDTYLKKVIDRIWDSGFSEGDAPVLWAVSNDLGERTTDDPFLTVATTIGVGSIDSNRERRGAYGPHVSVVAPGQYVSGTTGVGSFDTGSGTSFATAIAAGIQARYREEYPGDNAVESRDRMIQSCVYLPMGDGAGRNQWFGHGLVKVP